MARRRKQRNPSGSGVLIALASGVGVYLLIRELQKRGTLGNGGYGSKPVAKPKAQPSGPTFWQQVKSIPYMPVRTTQDYGTPTPTPAPAAPAPTPTPAPAPAPVAMPTLQTTSVKPEYGVYSPGQFDITGQPSAQPAAQPLVSLTAPVAVVPAGYAQPAMTQSEIDKKAYKEVLETGKEMDDEYKGLGAKLESSYRRDKELTGEIEKARTKYYDTIEASPEGGPVTEDRRRAEANFNDLFTERVRLREECKIDRKNADMAANEMIRDTVDSVRKYAGGQTTSDMRMELETRKLEALAKLPKEPTTLPAVAGTPKPTRPKKSEFGGQNYYERFKEAEKMFRQVNPNDALAYDVLLTSPSAWDAKVKQFAKERNLFVQFEH